MVRIILAVSCAFLATVGTASAQGDFEEEFVRACTKRVVDRCLENEGDGYGTPQQCFDASWPDECHFPGNEAEENSPNRWIRERDFAYLRLEALENHCSGRITCLP